MQSTIDATMGGILMNKTGDEAYNLIKKMVLNNYQRSNVRSQAKRVRGELELDALTLLSAKLDAMTQRMDRVNVNFSSLNGPSP